MASLQDLLIYLHTSPNPHFTAYDPSFLTQACTLPVSDRPTLRVEVEKLVKDIKDWDARFLQTLTAAAEDEEKTWRKAFVRDSKGELANHTANASLVLRHDPRWKGTVAFNDLTHREVSTRPPPWGDAESPGEGSSAGLWTDLDDVRVSLWMFREYELNLSTRQCADVIQVTAQKNAFHPVRDYLTSQRWDGTPRIHTWLRDYLHVTQENEEYVQRISAWSLMGAVARVMMPGCQLDYVLTLIGDQGLNKSSVVRALSPEKSWVMTHDLKLDSKDALQDLQGKWIVELAEIDSMSKYDQGKVKSFVTKPIDTYRRSYGRRTEDIPRQCVFIATGNEGEFLHDLTGGRRWWPATCERADLRGLLAVREQLWAEAFFHVAHGKQYWPEPDEEIELFKPEQEARRIEDPWECAVQEYLQEHASEPGFSFTTHDILCWMSRCSGVDANIRSWTKSDQTRIGQIVHSFGWVRRRVTLEEAVLINGRAVSRLYRYYRSITTTKSDTNGSCLTYTPLEKQVRH